MTSDALLNAGADAATIDRHIKQALHEGSSIYALDADRLAELAPDLIVTQELCEVCAVSYAEVRRAARRLPGDVPVVSLEPGSLDDILATVHVVGAATGCEAGAERVVAAMRERIAVVDALQPPDSRPVVVCLEWTDPLMVGGHWVPEMVARAGGVDPLGTPGVPSQPVTWDAVLDAHPDVLVLMPCGFGLARTLELSLDVTGRLGFGCLPCARSGRVVAVDGSSYFNRPGPRLVESLEMLVREATSIMPCG